ncbi:Ultraviolet-B receptor UVR8 [Apostasia shenzhenica]|uniref:Ultraviolet-B receptor UVR8 n=1 Tax=Apostasia shenzhenica TaxID=1088818 RepID=A0A2I0B3P1_9ASPA|nr:Ultraviolet-B receptor UVR8 [Apostasia shenzhenica]
MRMVAFSFRAAGAAVLAARFHLGSSGRRAASVWSFGDNSNGALGITTPLVDAYEPTKVPLLPSTVTSVAAGHYHSLAVTAEGEVWAWGRNVEGQLGRGPDAPRDTWSKPEKVLGLEQVKVHAAYASGVVSAAIGNDGSLWVWGRSKRGQLGLGEGVVETIKPSKVEAFLGHEISKVSFGWGHALARTKDGKLFGWGYAENGRLGKMWESSLCSMSHYLNSDRSLEKSVTLLEAAEKIEEENMPIIWEPTVVQELSSIEVSDVACGLDHSLVLCCDDILLSCGDNTYGQLGRKTEASKMLPVPIDFHPLYVSAGLGHTLVLYQTPAVRDTDWNTGILSWGWNQSSQLGRQGQEDIPAPVEGVEGERIISVSAGRVHSIALTSKGEVLAWGSGRNGKLGLQSSADETVPAFVDCLEGFHVMQVVAGFDHTLALVVD